MITEIFDANLRRLRLMNTGQSRTGKQIDKTLLMENFLLATYDLGLHFSKKPCSHKSLAFQSYIEESILLWPNVKLWIRGFIHRTEVILNYAFEGNEWVRVCHRRSTIEFLKELYQGTSLEKSVKALDISVLDEKIRRVGEIEGYLEDQEIPAAMPLSHWWWWYPPALALDHELPWEQDELTSNGHHQIEQSDFTLNEIMPSQKGAATLAVFSPRKGAYQELAKGAD